ncbi:MAG TPA: S8 family serine peptidase [Rhodanobacteraceae bacterium]|jgi:subtilisin family serine protease|nr:S8 family serine peptidase [Rhodanobacteraceae bacterium]
MGNSFRITALASAISLAIGVSASPAAHAVATTTDSQTATQQQSNSSYLIRFAEAGLLHYDGGTQGLRATAPNASGSRKLDVHTAAAQAYQGYLRSQRDSHLAAIAQAIGHPLAVTHVYAITMNGVAANLSAQEAAAIAQVPGVVSVRLGRSYEIDTYRGPEFIGADTIWDGSSVPGGVGSRGEGVVVADIDTGINSAHPSFADDPTCGFGADNHKLLSAVDCSTTDVDGRCNGSNPEADDTNGHGVHTASTAAGNKIDSTAVPPPAIPAPHTFMSGVAQCAQLRTYKVCPIAGCTDAAITAGIENAIADQVDAANFSIGPTCGSSPGESPWTNGDEIWLDALNANIFVAASAGNTRANCTSPIGKVANLGPWVITVAASTHDENVSGTGLLSATGPGSPPANTQNISLNPGTGVNPGQPLSSVPIRHYATNEIGCTDSGGFPAGYFDGAIALISRGTCTFEEKIDNAEAAGALVAIIYNNAAGVINMATGAAALPAYSILQTDGQALVTFIDGNDPTPTTVDFSPAHVQGDVIAGFSDRGPNVFPSITKPDITGPGVNIYAAVDAASNSYAYMSGTSMSAPHTTGSGALLRAVHPDWTPSEIKSALMLTAFTNGYEEDGTTPWTPDDVGAGRIDLSQAARVGFVMNETYDNYVAANPAIGGDPTTLNLASGRNLSCDTSCSFTRTLRNVMSGDTSWTVSVNAPTGVNVTVDPQTFAFTGGDRVFGDGFDNTPLPPLPQFQTITITAAPTSPLTAITFAEVVFHEANGLAPDAHIYIAVQGNP